MSEKLLEVQHLQQYFPVSGGIFKTNYVQAVDDVSFYINKGLRTPSFIWEKE